jgi:hypothetical protein
MDTDGKKFWVPDPEHGFLLGRLVDIGHDSLTIEPFDTPGKVCFRISHVDNCLKLLNLYSFRQ